MVCLARDRRIVTSTVLSEALSVSQRYSLQIAGKLRDGGLIAAHPGMNGGYSLIKMAAEISAYDVIKLMEGDMSIPDCEHPIPDCGCPCEIQNMYESLHAMKEYVDAYLKTLTFDRLAGMDITGHLAEILGMVEDHISEISQGM